ncbi:E3 SUMO-protein ligase ZBED1-like [Saccostrea cucullata]|uniref:E3 SUMO-protein ligase ZBED1-like n=1 Tax=Saccostrea cuccullata TaxID=36930 RepID=UPI002ED208DE
MEKAGILFQAEHHIKCYADTLDLAAQKSLKVKQVSHILARMRKIVAFFHRSSVATTAKLREQAGIIQLPAHKLLIDVPTRWNSAYDMVCRFLEMQCAVTTVLRMKEVSRFRDKDINSFTDEDLAFAEEVMECLKPLKTVTTSLCSESMPTISVIMPIQHTLLHKMQTREDDSTGIKQMKNAIVQDLQHRYEHQREFLTLASFVDPRFKSLPFLEDDTLKEKVHSNVINKLAELGPMKIKQEPKETSDPPLPSLPNLDPPQTLQTADDSTQGIGEVAVDIDSNNNNNSPQRKKLKQENLASLYSDVYVVSYTPATEKTCFEKATENIETYKSLPPAPFNSDPLQWWKMYEDKCPLVASLARKILCIPATSVASERIFSTAGDIVSSQRACLKPCHMDKLIFLKKKSAVIMNS